MLTLGIRYIRYYSLLIFMCTVALAHPDGSFVHENRDPSGSEYESTIVYMINEQEVGHVSIRKLPIFHFYVLHTFYVHPEHRNNGFGKELLEYACHHLISLNASRIYIQPGPFELSEDGSLIKPVDEYEQRVVKLINLYSTCGFTKASRSFRACAYLLYKCMNLEENPQHLMVKIQ